MTHVLEALDKASSMATTSTSTSSSSSITFARVEAEQAPAVSNQYQVTMVPTLLFLDENGHIIERMEGVENVAEVTQAVARLEKRPSQQPPTSTPASVAPSKTSITMITTTTNRMGEVVVMNEEKTGNTTTENKEDQEEEELKVSLNRLIRSSQVMVFMKGTPSTPKCGFSRQMVELLQQEHIPFGSFDILTNDKIRQGLKVYSNWPTYPQLYVHGEFVGGFDIVKEMKEEEEGGAGGLRKQLQLGDEMDTIPPATQQVVVSLDERLRMLTKRSRVMLFMKGLPSAPRCGFSRQIVEILNRAKTDFDAFDILQDNEVREGLKHYSNWPTYPQLYVDGELVGGLDIVQEMNEDGSLKELLTSS